MTDAAAALAHAVACVFGAEGYRSVAYLDRLASRPCWTIGHGTTRVNGQPVHEGMTCTREQADAWAMQDMRATAAFVQSHVRVPMTVGQFAALISFAYNLGDEGFARSDVCQLLNAGQTRQAADAMLAYDHAGGREVDGLETRRKRERALFLSDDAVLCAPLAQGLSEADQLNQKELDRMG